MDLNEIKEIIENDGGKFIIVENGNPVMVITSFEDYKKRLRAKKISDSGETNKKNTKEPLSEELEEDGLKIEDLPF